MLSHSEFKNVKENTLIALYQEESHIANGLHNALFIFRMREKYLSTMLERRDEKISFDKNFSERNKLNIKLYRKISLRWKVLN